MILPACPLPSSQEVGRLLRRGGFGPARVAILLGVTLVAWVFPAHAQAPPGLDAFVERTMGAFEVPGLALAIVKDGTVAVAKGYGVRRLGERERVDARTLFGIASNTKVFTATALGLLVEEGKIEWDAPVVQYLPWFHMWDPWVTRELTVRDLLVHRSGLGLGAGDLLWWPASTYNRREIAARLRFIRPATSFRSAYAYDNVLYIVAGELIESVTGQSWEDFISARILSRVGMADSNARHSAVTRGGNLAWPHARVDGIVRPIAPFTSDNTNAAGGINSNAADMARWLLVQLGGGRLPDGSRLFSDRTARELTTIVTPMPTPEPPPELPHLRSDFHGYGLGLVIRDYRGRKVVTHVGGLPGYVSRVFMLPGEQLGVAVLTNQEATEAFDAIALHVADYYIGAPQTDWLDGYLKVRERQRAERAAVERKAASVGGAWKPSAPLAAHVGNYADAWYGEVTVALEDDRLVMRFARTPALVGDLEHWQHETFIVRWRDRELRADAYATFSLDPEGRIDQIRMRAVSPDADFSYDFHDLLLLPVKPAPAR